MSSISINDQWHTYSQWTYRTVTGTLSADYDINTPSTLNMSFSGQQYTTYNSGYGPDVVQLKLDGNIVATCNVSADNGTYSISVSHSNQNTNTNVAHTISLYIQCGDTDGCPYDYHNNPHLLGSVSVDAQYSQPTTLELSSSTKLEKDTNYNMTYQVGGGSGIIDWVKIITTSFNKTNTSQELSWNSGIYLNPIDRTGLANDVLPSKVDLTGRVYDDLNSDGTRKSKKYVEGTYIYKPSSHNLVDGSKYKIAVVFSDNKYEWISYSRTIYTYTDPTISGLKLQQRISSSSIVDIPSNTFSPYMMQGSNVNAVHSARLKWTQNNRNHPDTIEDDFETTISTNQTSQTLTTYSDDFLWFYNNPSTIGQVDKLFGTTNGEKNVAKIAASISVKRKNPSSGKVSSASSATITLQFQPTETPTNFSIKTSGVSIGDTISKSTYPTVRIEWKYPRSTVDSGFVKGYRIEIFKDNSYSSTSRTLDTYIHMYDGNTAYNTTSSIINSPYYDINVRDNCTSLVMNYIRITPCYKYDSSSTPINGTASYTGQLFIPYGELSKPIIAYPVNGTTWHNRNFRVLFQLPNDDDYNSSQAGTYRYSDIEVYILGRSNLISQPYDYTWANYSFMYSTDTLSYQKKIVINPSLTLTSGNLSLGGLGNFQQYKIKIRVAKLVLNNKIWSAWSDEITVNKSELEPLEAGGEDYLAIYEELNEILDEYFDRFSGTGDTNINIYNELNTILDESDSYSGGGQGTITVGGIIRASHYNTIRDYSERLRSVYSPLASEDVTNTQVQVGDIINHEKYLKVYNTIKRIQSSVNNYTTFDNNRNNVKFNQTINLLDGNDITTRGEIITAERDLRPGSGRDYLLLLYDSMSLLY